MRLATFIASHHESILHAWVAFARNQLPAARNLDAMGLEDHGTKILEEIVRNMGVTEDEREVKAKSEGNSLLASTSARVPSRSHARQRERQGFEVGQMVAEYRALRATVLRLWRDSSRDAGPDDLDDMMRFNEAVDQALAESVEVFIAELDRARDLFLGVMGHDLRGPLSSIASAAAVELRKWPDDVRFAPLVLRSVRQMKALLDDLMEFTTYRLGKGLNLSPTHMQLDQFARETLDEIETVTKGRTLQLECHGDMAVEWDQRRIHQALSNLVFNALKYGFADSPIVVAIDGTASHVQLGVRNTGKPIAPHLLPRLFDPLVREEREDDESGSQVAGANLGLGLYVVREIATAHGGTVEVTSTAQATEFCMRLPRICTAPPGPADTPPAASVTTASPAG
ncbi:sensor histidine kinase [Acidovorax sp. RAC01]|uniref:sensor histidine kinase n=1 Tax=Acidovorax sp. RAC01 TaxID=1842533 RepID=UPI00083E801F|nr:sensor histidine kinase [Acidovorax sp. RAC01]AOG23807.1 his Kinase A domain protein [Acidovorax sp. RAC01]